jgi:ParB family chromosome partitioning protein
VERLLAARAAQKAPSGRQRLKLSGQELLKEYEAFTEQQRALVAHATIVHERLTILVASMKQLLTDEPFVRLLRKEGLDTIPEQLTLRMNGSVGART